MEFLASQKDAKEETEKKNKFEKYQKPKIPAHIELHKNKDWVNYIKLPHRRLEMATHKPFKFLKNDEFVDVYNKNSKYEIDTSLQNKPAFQLFFRTTRAADKNLVLG